VFFFSSRRRHTRSKRDWSSDVCSSDLVLLPIFYDSFTLRRAAERRLSAQAGVFLVGDGLAPLVAGVLAGHLEGHVGEPAVFGCRSEERRVGKARRAAVRTWLVSDKDRS